MIRIVGLFAIACCLVASQLARAEPAIPRLWDAKERLQKPDLSKLERLRFLTTTDFPPFNFLDASGRLSGFHIDLARAICAEVDLTDRCQIQALPWPDLEAALAQAEGEAVIAGIAVTPEARTQYLFSRPYLVFPARFIALKSKLFDPLGAIPGARIGVLARSQHEAMLRADFESIQVITFDKLDWLTADLKAGKLDAAFGDGMRLSFWLAERDAENCCRFAGGPYLSSRFLGNGMSIAVPRDRPELAAAFDYALQAMAANGKFGEFYLRYFPVGFF